MRALLNAERMKGQSVSSSSLGFLKRKKRFPNLQAECSVCGEKKRLKEIASEKYAPDDLGLSVVLAKTCLKCSRKKNSESMYFCQAKRRYGIGKEKYCELATRQKGVCAICDEPCRQKKRLSVDHNHTTGAIRGLLCVGCNRGIGMFLDKPERLRKAAMYLEERDGYETGV